MLLRNIKTILLLLPVIHSPGVYSQVAERLIDHFPGILAVVDQDSTALFSVEVNRRIIFSDEFIRGPSGTFKHPALLIEAVVSGTEPNTSYPGRILSLTNRSGDTLEIENFIPLGPADSRPYITGYGPSGLARATLFQPGKGPVGLIVPDNAWELGFTTLDISPDSGMAVLARRESWDHANRKRYSTILLPGGEVSYRIYIDKYQGNWRSGLIRVFRDCWLHDLEDFDNRLYERKDLRWIREDFLAVLQFAWDKDFVLWKDGSYDPFREFFHRYDHFHGGYDIYAIWQGWPRLGLDKRNQWDLIRDLPGGTDSMRVISQYCRDHGSAFFISYNPWDKSIRPLDHLEGMAGIIKETQADGVVLDTRGSSSEELQKAADQAKKGVIMYSEGMAVPRDMPGIISGRVHNAIRMSPPLNLNRLIKPGFQIFRVLDLRDGRIHREMAISLFNGYGAEINLFSPAHPWWVEEEYQFMGRCLMILRQNREAFHDETWIPLVESPDSIWVNEWHFKNKILYTVLSLKPEGHSGKLIDIKHDDLHWVSLWDHEEIPADGSSQGLEYHVEPFSPVHSGTRREGEVQCIAGFRKLLDWDFAERSLNLKTSEGDKILLWKGDPSYSNRDRKEFQITNSTEIKVPLSELIHSPEGKIVIQLFEGDELMDERIIHTFFAAPVKINDIQPTMSYTGVPDDMVEIEGGPFYLYRENDADFIPYPDNYDSILAEVEDFYMDRYPVTNEEYFEFIHSTKYSPEDTVNFLKHWNNGTYPDSLADHPVVWINLEDARAYARWKGKRLPAEIEWQYASQGSDGRKWPWGNSFDSTACNNATGHTTAVYAFPGGRSPFGVEDLTGNVWQLCADEYFNGSFSFSIIRGGSFFKPTSSWWYIQGGPQPNDKTQMLLRTSPGFDRSETVGFRCVCDK